MREIVQRFAEEGYMIDPDALELIASYPRPWEELVEGVIRGLSRSTLVVVASDIRSSSTWKATEGSRPSSSPPRSAPPSPPQPRSKASAPKGSPRPTSPGGVGAGGRIHHEPSDDDGISPSKDGISPPEAPAPGRDGGPTRPVHVGGQELDGRPLPAWGANCCSSGPQIPAFGGRDLLGDRHASPLSPSEAPIVPAPPFSLEGLSDITGRSTCVGEYQDFVRYFRDRYSKIRDILSGRVNGRPIESLKRGVAGREISVIGMVMDVRTSAKGNRVVELEDPTGTVTVIFSKGDPGTEDVATLVPDEVIGVTGTTDGKGRFFSKSFIRPDLQARAAIASGEGGALLLSDIHAGSTYFMEEAWDRFVGWISGEEDDPLGIASKVRYAVIAGDLVDGIGVYPGHEGDLAIKDIWEQYERAAELLRDIPERVQIVLSPGNHDAVRQAEPQPALPEFLRGLFKSNVTFVGNPAAFRLGGVEWLVYHGRSIDDLVLKIPGLSYGEPEKAMVEMLKRRHLSPIYGNRVSIAPEVEDHMVIDRQPAVLHSGHVHTVGMTRYKGVTAINSGTWQGQTDFQKKMNIQPTPAIVPYLDLATMRARRLIFD
ncbi:DNA-directed DNA polymerase II small subunit [Candidatus Methanocrinis natronophilus]|uniref:DNA polymerase II small subunit n=1 Tax=Candidatus Methanocrinis natronophilus TaxID=3033396 RepID=A0ABT5X8Q8_9EURY|nr:DNA-directed DNA polymerase II small subunit [Candidatus Methanocrinis natronophilus]MDF0591090.1 DNA-directed DNA polymerase II small subunit [Candidatus Methanocrinis natronophilus]